MRLSETLKLWVLMIEHSYQEAQLTLLILNLRAFGVKFLSWKWCRCAKKDKYEVCAMHIVHESSRKMKTQYKPDGAVTGSGSTLKDITRGLCWLRSNLFSFLL